MLLNSGLCVLTSVAAVVAAGLGVVEGRVADEEAGREQPEADRVDRHDRPVLRGANGVGAEGKPETQLGAGGFPAGPDEGGQAVAALRLVRVGAGGEDLVPNVGGDTERVGDEAGPLGDGRARVGERFDGVLGHELVGDRLAELVLDVVVDDLPVAAGHRVGVATAHRLVLDERLLGAPGVADGIVRALGDRRRGDLVDAVGGAVDRHVQADVEEVLVVRAVDARGDDRAELRLDAVFDRAVGDDAGELDLVLDGAVLVDVPVVAVLVVADVDDTADHHPAHAADFGVAGAEVGMLPGDAMVLFVQADGVLHRERVAVVVVDDAVQVDDLAQAVAPELQRVGEQADAVLPLVEDQLAVVGQARVAVGDEHLAEGGTVDDRPAGVVDLVQDQALAGGEADPQVPLLPFQVVVPDGEAGALVLDDVEWLDVGSGAVREVGDVVRVGDRGGGVVAGLLRDRDDAFVLDRHDGKRVEVDERADVLDRVGVAVVARAFTDPGEGRDETAVGRADAGFDVGRRPRVDHAQVEVGYAALAHGVLPARVVADDVLGGEELLEHHARLHAGDAPEVDDLGSTGRAGGRSTGRAGGC